MFVMTIHVRDWTIESGRYDIVVWSPAASLQDAYDIMDKVQRGYEAEAQYNETNYDLRARIYDRDGVPVKFIDMDIGPDYKTITDDVTPDV
jgi:hypothetical protein